MTETEKATRDELYAQVDQLLPPEHAGSLNVWLKRDPGRFDPGSHIRLPTGTTRKALKALARQLVRARW